MVFAGVVARLREHQPNDRTMLEAGLKRWPDSAELHMGLAMVEDRDGRLGEARKHLEVIATQNAAPKALRDWARARLAASIAREREQEFKTLVAQRDYLRARERAAELARAAPPQERAAWERFAEQARLLQLLEEAEELVRNDRRAEAPPLLREILASPVMEFTAKTKARMLLRQLEP